MDFGRFCGPFYKFSLICILVLIVFQYETVTYWTAVWKEKLKVKPPTQHIFMPAWQVETESANDKLNELVQQVNILNDQLKQKVKDESRGQEQIADYDIETGGIEDDTDFNDTYLSESGLSDMPERDLEEPHYRNIAVIDLKPNYVDKEPHYRDVVFDSEPSFVNTSQTLIVLFSSWAFSQEKSKVHETLLRLWSSWLVPSVQPLVLTNDAKVRHLALTSNWSVLPVTKSIPMCKGPPVLRNLFIDTQKEFDAQFYGYANADIIFGDGLVQTLKFLRNNYRWTKKPLLVVGRRYNYDFKHSHVRINDSSNVRSLLKQGQLVRRSTDFFFTNKLFPWKVIPAVSIGRPFVVRAVIGYAIKRHYDIIDATRTIESVHLTTADGILASWHKPGVNCNKHLLLKEHHKLPLDYGHCECAKLETVRDKKGHIHLRSRKPSRTICPGLK